MVKDKPFQCAYCDKSFSQSSNRRTKHERIHTKDKPYHDTNVHSVRRVSLFQVSRQRMKGFTPRRNHSHVPYCDKSFSQGANKTRYEQIHSIEKPYQCAL